MPIDHEATLNALLDELTKVLESKEKGAKKIRAIGRIVVEYQHITKWVLDESA